MDAPHTRAAARWLIPVACAVAVAVGVIVFPASGSDDSFEPANLPLKQVADVSLGGRPTRLDYASLDPTRHLLFIAHLGDGQVIVLDTRAPRVIKRIAGVASVHGVLAIPELSRVYASATGSNEIIAIDETTLNITARMPGGIYPDGMAYVPDAHKLYVSDEAGATETVIDVRSNTRIATIPLGGEVGNTQYDPASRHIFVNVQSRRQLVEIDPATDRIVTRIDLPGARGNHGLLVVPEQRLAFVACEGNDKLLVLDMRTMHVISSFDVGQHPDVLAFDSDLHLLYVAGEAGTVSMFKAEAGRVSKIGDGRIGPNAHVVAVDESTHYAFFPLSNVRGQGMLRIVEPRE
jgi:DNA-binding beta-propeller fold protein YncE